jgi:fructokinase
MPGYRPLLIADVEEVAGSLPSHSVFYFDRVAPGTLELARRSRAQGAFVVFEPSGIKDEDTFVECLRTAHVLKYSHERLASLDQLVSQTKVPMEVRTLGAAGLQFRVRRSGLPGAWQQLTALEAPSLRDAAGSGDWCTAGLISKLMSEPKAVNAIENTETVAAALRYGQALAALNCAYDGARGLMYATSRATAKKAAAQVLASIKPHLPDMAAATPNPCFSESSCIVCTSILKEPTREPCTRRGNYR